MDGLAIILFALGIVPLVVIALAFRSDGKSQRQRTERRMQNLREIWPDKSEEEIHRTVYTIEHGRHARGNYGFGSFRNYG